MLGFGPEGRVGYAQVVVSAKLEQSLAIVVHLADTELSKTRGPGVVISTQSGVDITQENELYFAGDLLMVAASLS